MPPQRRSVLALLAFLAFPALLFAAVLGLTGCPGGLRPPGDCGLVLDAGTRVSSYDFTYLDTHGKLIVPGGRSVVTRDVLFGVCPPGYSYPAVSAVTVTAPSGAVLS